MNIVHDTRTMRFSHSGFSSRRQTTVKNVKRLQRKSMFTEFLEKLIG